MKKMSFMFMVIVLVFAFPLSTCLGQEYILKLEYQDGMTSSNLTPPPDGSWVFLYLPLGKYCFDTSVQLDEINQSKVSPTENVNPLEQKTFILQFSLKW